MTNPIGTLIENLANKQDILQTYIDDIESSTNGNLKNDRNFQELKRSTEERIPAIITFLRNNAEIIQYEDFLEDAFSNIQTLDENIKNHKPMSNHELSKLVEGVNFFNSQFNLLSNGVSAVKQSRDLVKTSITPKLQELEDKIKDVEALRLALHSRETDKIYLGLSEKYEEEYELNNEYFRNSLIVTVCCTILSIAYTFNTPIADINWAVFISVKLLILAVGITLCTLFLRRSAHAKKLHEKSYQTHVEINAYPIFIKSLEKADQQEITKELALRYFGNDIDQTQNDKIGDLVQDQLSVSAELIRASAEMVRAKQSKGGEVPNG